MKWNEKQSWVPLKLKGSIPFPYESAGHAGPTLGTGWDERVFLVIQAGRSLESHRLSRHLSRSGTSRTAKRGRTGSSAWTLAHLVRVCEPEPQFLHVWNADVWAVEKTLEKAVQAYCRSPENAWGALCLSFHAISLPSPVRAEGNLSPAWESPSPFPSPWPPLIPFLRTEEAALATWSPGPQCWVELGLQSCVPTRNFPAFSPTLSSQTQQPLHFPIQTKLNRVFIL